MALRATRTSLLQAKPRQSKSKIKISHLLVGLTAITFVIYIAANNEHLSSNQHQVPEKDHVKKLPFILITGVKYSDCSSDGMPSKNEFTRLYSISDSVKAIMDKFVENKAVGTFTYQCERLDYYYIKDTLELRQALSKLYSTHFKSYDPYINIKEDKNWDAYLSFLYPNEETFEYMQNQKVIQHLEDSGDKLEKARKVDHWIYFHTETDRNCFINYITKHNFKIELKEKTDDANRPYKLQISRVDKVDLPSISGITIDLRKESKKCNGDYDGWETLVIK